MLKPLLLPQLVEERRKRETLVDEELNVSQSSDIHEPSAPDCPSSPSTLTLSSKRSHVRYSSSVSSIDNSMHSPLSEIPSSPTFAAMKTSKRSLPDVQEDPLERDEDLDMFDDDLHDVYDWSCDDNHHCHHESSMGRSSVQLSTRPDFEYDLADGITSDTDLGLSITKKRRAGDSPFSAIANRFGTRFPGLTRKWRAGKGSNPLSLSDLDGDLRASRTASSRSSSVSNSVSHGLPISFGDVQMPPTPAMSEFDRHDTPYRDSEEFERLDHDSERPAGFVSTPLLPPMMMGSSTTTDADIPLQSPLESPSVADPTDYLSGACTPVTGIATPARGMPSPPLSTKPSMSSIRRTHTIAPVHLSTSSSDALPLVIADIDDKWSNTLGHANFTIHPPPYLPTRPDVEACRQLKRDWDLAQCNYTKHLVRTGEHYGATSKTYLLTEEKWKETDDLWRANNDATIAATAASGEDAFRSLKHNRVGEAENAMTKIPSLNDPRCEGKFPQLGDEDIVGPMVVGVARMQRRRSRKAGLVRFFAEKFPVGFGRG